MSPKPALISGRKLVKVFEKLGYEMGFDNVASGPMVRSSYHADLQAAGPKK